MVRAFRPDPVEPERLRNLLDLARRAPSAGNVQAVELLVLDTPETVARYWDVTLAGPARASFGWPGLLRAPVLVVVATAPEAYPRRYGEDDKSATGLGVGTDAWAVPYWWVDAGAVVQNLLLAVVDAGLFPRATRQRCDYCDVGYACGVSTWARVRKCEHELLEPVISLQSPGPAEGRDG